MRSTRRKAHVVSRKGVTVRNLTYYNTLDIVKLVQACMKEHEHTEGAHKHYDVEIGYTRTRDTMGWGWYHFGRFRILLRNPLALSAESFVDEERTPRATPVEYAAQVIEHEMYHCMGFYHTNSKDQYRLDRYHPMPDLVNHCNQDVPWSEGLELRWEPPQKKEKPTGAAYHEDKLQKAQRRITKLKQEIKDAEALIVRKKALVKKWGREVTLRTRLARTAAGGKK